MGKEEGQRMDIDFGESCTREQSISQSTID